MQVLRISGFIGILILIVVGYSKQTQPQVEPLEIYILMGQSNMAGRDTSALDTQVDDKRIVAFREDNTWQVARDPIHKKTGRTEPGIGPGIPFAKAMLDSGDVTHIGLVPTAVGGSPLRRWEKGGDLYAAAMEKIKFAIQHGKIKGVLWHQGESDSDKQSNAETYGVRLIQMFQDLRADLGMPNLPIVVGEMGYFLEPERFPFASHVREGLRNTADSLKCVGFVGSIGLEHKGDQLHFSAPSAIELGERFAKAMIEIECGD